MFNGSVGSLALSLLPHGYCYLWQPLLLWSHVGSDVLIGLAYVGISITLYVLVRRIRLPFSPVFIAFGLFIGLCGLTHFMEVWTVWNPDYWASAWVKIATAGASVATAIGLVYVKPQVEEVVHAARLSEERRIRLESTNAELAALYAKVKELDDLKSQFFANVSHELRTPLALILGPAEQLLLEPELTPAQRRQLESIDRNARMLLKQVNDLLDISKLEAGKMQLHYAQVDLAHWFRLIASQFEAAAARRGIDYALSAPATLPAQVDADKLERILINLLSNAFKFTPDGGRLRAALSGDRQEVRLLVADSGPGVDPRQREVIFERFRQADGGATRRHGGTGLGLAIVKDFVDLHGGRIDVRQAGEGGALFEVTLPATAPEGAEVEPAPATLTPISASALQGALQELSLAPVMGDGRSLPVVPGRPQVLVVEDNPQMREFVAETLAADYNVVTAEDGQEGLERADALRPDLIVTDVMMPRLSGDRLVAALRERREFDGVPILLLTARSEEELRVKLLAGGAQDYLTKPFLPVELRARAANLVQAKRAADTLRQELASMSTDLEVLAREIAVKNRHLQTALDAAEVAREQAERASQVKSYFLGMISHEMRTPLSTVQMNLQLLARDGTGGVPEAMKPRLQRLAAASQQMSDLIEGLLEYTRLESGRLVARLDQVDVAGLAAEAVEEHRLSTPQDRLPIRLERPAAPVYLTTDPRLLKVVVSNLLSNAVKFTQEGVITLRVADHGGQAGIEVQDTGLGIPPEALERIFLPFEQLEPVQRKKTPGAGLGLALVKQIVEALGGQVEVASEPGVGSRFRILLPLSSSAPGPTQAG